MDLIKFYLFFCVKRHDVGDHYLVVSAAAIQVTVVVRFVCCRESAALARCAARGDHRLVLLGLEVVDLALVGVVVRVQAAAVGGDQLELGNDAGGGNCI